MRARGTTPPSGRRTRRRAAAAVAACWLAASCGGDGAHGEELLRLQELERRAHLTYDAELLASVFADTLVTVRDGRVDARTRDEARRRFSAYLDEVTFLEWSDVRPPEVAVSASGDLATVRVQRRVRLGSVDSAGRSAPEHTVFAWTETWRRRSGAWELASVTSTERAGREDVAASERRAELQPAGRAPGEILERARAAAGVAEDPVRATSFAARGFSPRGPFRTFVYADAEGRIELRQTTSSGERVRRSVGPLGGREADSAAGLRAFLQGHALLHLAAYPTAVLGPPREAGAMTFAGRRSDVVVFEDGAGHPLELVYDRASGHLSGARVRSAARPAEVVLVYLSGREEVDGRVLPRRAAFEQDGDLYLYRIDEIRVDGPPPRADDSLRSPRRGAPSPSLRPDGTHP